MEPCLSIGISCFTFFFYVLLDVFNVFIVFVLHDSIVLFYLLCMFNVNRAPWKSSVAILKGLYPV